MSASIPRGGPTVIQEPMRQGTRATRGVDFSSLFTIPGDTIESIASIVVQRLDGAESGADDLTVTPEGVAAPWVGANPKGATNTLVGWWQSCGPMTEPDDVPYLISILVNTALGALIGGDVLQVVTSALSFGTVPIIGPTPPAGVNTLTNDQGTPVTDDLGGSIDLQ